jgi:hypothetical protein
MKEKPNITYFTNGPWRGGPQGAIFAVREQPKPRPNLLQILLSLRKSVQRLLVTKETKVDRL